ncbi:TonB-dependent receptor [Capnocytophaga catalasegens]|uniref:Membrane protein n=1 Tax=Capnocytophaga catalasegens TaxID=1004260 RepID=A0AAV5AW29_9FLAO|nr:TonB-dependent receptor [Capnocytophaga catalasegens]GIZ14637.1 membrane protein [Capnocytophaga catalasegens]GJM50839.1 membrane protein [Capnocytophaga catalasegens]GJM51992.1 membrane protein [Capnocytophaga catalasegens]
MRKLFCFFVFLSVLTAYAQQTLHLKIEDKQKQPLSGAVVHIIGKHYVSDTQGEVLITSIKSGIYPLRVTFLGFLDYEDKIQLPLKGNTYTIVMKEAVNELSEVVVLGEEVQKKVLIYDPVIVTKTIQNDLHKLQGESLAKILSTAPGISMIQTGATIAKPVIHGLHSNRILILNNEVRQEGQQWGADHAPEVDPYIANQITIIKGAQAVRYGSDALGGVIVLSPNKLPYGDALHGEVLPSFSTNGRKMATSVKLESAIPGFSQCAWRVQGSVKRAGDIATADYLLNNTAMQERNFSLATGIEKEQWGIDAFYSQYANESGIFYGSHIGNLDDLLIRFEIGRPLTSYPFSYQIEAPKQKVIHHLLKIKSFVALPFGGKLTALYAFQSDIRQEFNLRRADRTRIPALNMNLSTHSLDVSWENSYKKHTTQLGVSAFQQVNYNEPGTGVVPVIPNYASFSYGVFAIQKYDAKLWEAEAGLRYDYKTLNADGYNSFSQRYGTNHTFHNITYSLGVNYKPSYYWSFASNIGVAWRSPHVNELYSNGLHHGAGTYDIGDENLQSETGIKWISSVRFRQGKWKLNTDVFVQLIRNYIFDAPTGKTRTLFSGVYPIFQFQQADVFFRGVDLEAEYRFLPKWKYSLQTSVVYANELKTNKYLPFIPSERISQELYFDLRHLGSLKNVYTSVKHQFVAKQTRYNPEQELVKDTPDAYHLFNIGIGAKIPFEKQSIAIHLSCENIFNQLYKEYTNRFRYYAHDLGRNIQFRFVYSF